MTLAKSGKLKTLYPLGKSCGLHKSLPQALLRKPYLTKRVTQSRPSLQCGLTSQVVFLIILGNYRHDDLIEKKEYRMYKNVSKDKYRRTKRSCSTEKLFFMHFSAGWEKHIFNFPGWERQCINPPCWEKKCFNMPDGEKQHFNQHGWVQTVDFIHLTRRNLKNVMIETKYQNLSSSRQARALYIAGSKSYLSLNKEHFLWVLIRAV